MALDISILLIQLAVVLVATRAGGSLARLLGQPRVVGEMAAGLCLGPSLLGRAAPVFFAALFPPASVGVLDGLSRLGLVLFMFRVGCDLDLDKLRSMRRVAALTSQVSIVIPLLVGSAIGAVAAPRLDPGHTSPAAGPFVGVALSVTAFPVLVRILVERGLARTTVGTLALACAAVDDVTAWILLAALGAWVQSGSQAATLVRILILTAVQLGILVAVIRPGLERLRRRWPDDHPAWPPLTLVILLVSAAAAERIGVHALFGAFVAGAAMPRGQELHRTLVGPFEGITDLLLLPLFFVITGLRTDLGRLHSPAEWGLAALILVAAVGSKLGTCALTARALGTAWRDAIVLGILMNTRGLVELVILGAGLELGVLGPSLYSVLVLMALLTTVMTTPLLDFVGVRGADDIGPPEGAPV